MNSNNSSEEDSSLWWVPLTYTSSKNIGFSRTKPSYWLKAEPQIVIEDVIVSPNDWLIFNIKQTGGLRITCLQWS